MPKKAPVLSERVRKLWADHPHKMVETVRGGGGCYSGDTRFKYCTVCDRYAARYFPGDGPLGGQKESQHHKHPEGCKCEWCVYCQCPAVMRREEPEEISA